MDNHSIAELILISIIGSIVVSAFFGIRTENSGLVANRITLLIWLVVPMTGIYFLNHFVQMAIPSMTQNEYFVVFVVHLIIVLVYLFYLFRIITRRARDAGQSKEIAYVCILPGINIFCILFLLLKPQEKALKDD